MQLGIIGFPKAGKTTILNALTRGHAATSAHASGGREEHRGVVKVPDARLQVLAGIFKPKKITPAEVSYVEVAETGKAFGRGEGWDSTTIAQLGKMDALVHVVRAFEDPAIPHVEGSVDPHRDIATMNLELAFADMALMERRIERITDGMKAAKAAERIAAQRELDLLSRAKAELEKDVPLRAQGLSSEERREIEHYQFLTTRPLLLIINIGEQQLSEIATLEREYRERYTGHAMEAAVLCGQIEMELAQMEEVEAAEFRADLGIEESGLTRVIHLSYSLLGLISFLTGGPDEVRAWTIRRGTPALEAAGKIHSDMERGFVRAEVVSYEELARCGGVAEARKQGLLRLEGKTYEVQDGDVIHFLFNV